MMIISNCVSVGKSHIIIASTLPTNASPSLPHANNSNTPPTPQTSTAQLPSSSSSSSSKPQKQQQKQRLVLKKQPSVVEIERAIGAGIFRDRDTERVSEENKTLFDSILSNSIGKDESSVEKKLRETGEWVIHRTEATSRSAGKQILMFVFLWAIPMWITAFLVASGIVKLPFSTPLLDDLLL